VAGFLGSYLHSIDAKGRVSLPASFRRGRESASFVLIQAQAEALSLYPEESWLEKQQELRELARRNPDFRPLVLRLTANAVEVTPDKQGRILIPDRMSEAIGLGSEARIVGAIDRVEIWEPGHFAEQTGAEDEAFDGFVRSIFA